MFTGREYAGSYSLPIRRAGNRFDRYKTEQFYFVRATELEIGKYKSGNVEVLDMWKK